MRLKSVYISQYKNLKDFTLPFDGTSFIDVFVGKNGTGKSNLFEALIEIFRHLYENENSKNIRLFDYTLRYEIEDSETEIIWKAGQFFINGKEKGQKTIGSVPLPENVLIYYAGHNDTVKDLVLRYEEDFRRRIKGADLGESRRFIGIGPEYKQLLLAVMLLQKPENKARQYVCDKIGIDSVSPDIQVMLKRPHFADGRLKALEAESIENFDTRTHFWGAEGVTRLFLDKLMTCIKGEFNHGRVYDTGLDQYRLPVNIKLFQKQFSGEKITDHFRQLDNLKTLGMLADIYIPIKLADGEEATVAHFSDGQFQSVYIYSIIELFKDCNCITLLDEPDAFLHPEWQFGFLTQVLDITETAAKKNHILMSSHSASTLCNFEEQSISLFTIDDSKVSWSRRSKKEIINQLSNSFIQYSEDESKLLIDNVIRSSLKPILFVEGPTDVSILNTAHKKLYPGEDIPILIQDAFGRGMLKTLLARHEIYLAYPDKHFFALFDFDDAYDDWRELGGVHQVTNIGLGLCKKLTDKQAHAFLLPVPENLLRAQVWDETNPIEKIKPNCHFCVEHIFWDYVDKNKWFKKIDEKTGKIEFRGDSKQKVKFAKDIVPHLDAECFEILRPMFEFIKSKC